MSTVRNRKYAHDSINRLSARPDMGVRRVSRAPGHLRMADSRVRGHGSAPRLVTGIDITDPKWRRLAQTLSEVNHPAAQFALWVIHTELPFSAGCHPEAHSGDCDAQTLARWQAFCRYWRPKVAGREKKDRFHATTRRYTETRGHSR